MGMASRTRVFTLGRLSVFLFISLLILAGCGGSSVGNVAPQNRAVAGVAVKGPIMSAAIALYRINADGTRGALFQDGITTDANGDWDTVIPNNEKGPFIVVATGGSYVDEATGQTVSLGAGDELRGIYDPATGAFAPVTALTDAMLQTVQTMLANGNAADFDEAMNAVIAEYERVFGFNPLTTKPATLPAYDGTISEQKYALVLAGFSMLGVNHPGTGTQFEKTMRVVGDFAEDGDLYTLGIQPLRSAIRGYKQLPTTPDALSSQGIQIKTPNFTDNLFGGSGGGSGNLNLMVGDGLNPGYTWGGGDIFELSVVRVSAPTVIVWGIATPAQDGIASPVTHGTVPAGAEKTSGVIDPAAEELTLENGVQYRVSASRLNGDNGYTEFTATGVAPMTYDVSIDITGLSGSLTIANGGDNVTVNSDGTASLSTGLDDGAAYNITVSTQPEGQTCSVIDGNGTVSGADVTVAIDCVTSKYTVSAQVSGLNGSLVLQNNGGGDLSFTTDGTQAFATMIDHGAAYAVSVLTQPSGQTCTVSDGNGTATADVTVSVDCVTAPVNVTVSVNVTGLSGTVVLQNNGGDDLTFSADGTQAFSQTLASGGGYAVTVQTQPAAQICTVTSGTGTANSDVTIDVACSAASGFTVSVEMTGLNGDYRVQLVQGGLIEDLDISADGAYTYQSRMADGTFIFLRERFKPANQTCEMGTGSSGAITENRTVTITCTTETTLYPISVQVSGMNGTGLVIGNRYIQGETLGIDGDGTHDFTTRFTSGSIYRLTIEQQPSGNMCGFTAYPGGSVSASTVVDVVCAAEPPFGMLSVTGPGTSRFGDTYYAFSNIFNVFNQSILSSNWSDTVMDYKQLGFFTSPTNTVVSANFGDTLDSYDDTSSWSISVPTLATSGVSLDFVNNRIVFDNVELEPVGITTDGKIILNGSLGIDGDLSDFTPPVVGEAAQKCDRNMTSNSGSLTVTVIDDDNNGQPLQGAIVQLNRNGTKKTTGGSGTVNFGNVSGTHDVHVFKDGHTWVSFYCVQPMGPLDLEAIAEPLSGVASPNSVVDFNITTVTGLDTSNVVELVMMDDQGKQLGSAWDAYGGSYSNALVRLAGVAPGTTFTGTLWAIERAGTDTANADSSGNVLQRVSKDATQILGPQQFTSSDQNNPDPAIDISVAFMEPAPAVSEKGRITGVTAPNTVTNPTVQTRSWNLKADQYLEYNVQPVYPVIHTSYEPTGFPDGQKLGFLEAYGQRSGLFWAYQKAVMAPASEELVSAIADPASFPYQQANGVANPAVMWTPPTQVAGGGGLTLNNIKLVHAGSYEIRWSLFTPPGDSELELPNVPGAITQQNLMVGVSYELHGFTISFHGLSYGDGLEGSWHNRNAGDLDTTTDTYERTSNSFPFPTFTW